MGEIEVTPQEMLAKDGMFEQLWYWDLSSCHEGCALHENFTSISRGNHLYIHNLQRISDNHVP